MLNLNHNQVSDLQPLSGLDNLRELLLFGNQVTDVTPLVALVNLELLRLKENPLEDTSPLANLENLSDVDVKITDPRQREDVNNDGTLDLSDLKLVGKSLGQAGPHDADVNGDGVVNIADLVLVGGVCCETPAAPLLHASVLDMFTAAEVKVWLTQAQFLGTTDPDFQNGIRFLEQLLAALTPKGTVLLPNYPNPFNPETWIPYHLAAATDVQITIYDATGRVVRRLDLGHQSAGYYTVRSRAAYWDGKNALGESVASGIYFYQLQADTVSHLRKMLILK
ncbi:T9SS type A sorting domain-containing protein [Candidatus Poribacteria bacterium]|nr:T9SS type A sorting domain-containing protein [Candidatus Poribacteria bacterium]